MPLSDRVLEADSLRIEPNQMVLSIGLPWFRSVPRSAIEDFKLEVDGKSIDVDRFEGLSAADFFVHDKEWFPQDRVKLTWNQQASVGNPHEVQITMKLVIPNLLTPDGKPIVVPTAISRRLNAQ